MTVEETDSLFGGGGPVPDAIKGSARAGSERHGEGADGGCHGGAV